MGSIQPTICLSPQKLIKSKERRSKRSPFVEGSTWVNPVKSSIAWKIVYDGLTRVHLVHSWRLTVLKSNSLRIKSEPNLLAFFSGLEEHVCFQVTTLSVTPSEGEYYIYKRSCTCIKSVQLSCESRTIDFHFLFEETYYI